MDVRVASLASEVLTTKKENEREEISKRKNTQHALFTRYRRWDDHCCLRHGVFLVRFVSKSACVRQLENRSISVAEAWCKIHRNGVLPGGTLQRRLL